VGDQKTCRGGGTDVGAIRREKKTGMSGSPRPPMEIQRIKSMGGEKIEKGKAPVWKDKQWCDEVISHHADSFGESKLITHAKAEKGTHSRKK